MNINLQLPLENDLVSLLPLKAGDFEEVYAAAADPEIWEQHPNKDRWKKEVFQTFFEGALQSKGAYKIVDQASKAVTGSTRFYDYNASDKSIFIGYTFFAKAFWGKGRNRAVKTLMLDYIFQFVNTVYLHIGASNIRSQISIARLGARHTGTEAVTYFGESPKMNFVYEITKDEWTVRKHDAATGVS